MIPWNVLNYILAVSSIKAKDFFLGMFIGMAPGTMTFLYIGVNLQSIQEVIAGKRSLSPIEIIFMVSGAIAIILIAIIVLPIVYARYQDREGIS